MKMRRHKHRQARFSCVTIPMGRLPAWYRDLSSAEEDFNAIKCMFRDLDQLLAKMDDYVKRWFPDRGRA